MTQDGTMMGSLNYMSPEQMLGKPVDQRSDVFSVGSVAYELLCYHQAFKGNLNDGLLHRLPHEDPPLLKEIEPSVPLAIEQVVMRALEKDPGTAFPEPVRHAERRSSTRWPARGRRRPVHAGEGGRPHGRRRPTEDESAGACASARSRRCPEPAQAGSPPPPTPRTVVRPPLAPAPLSEIREPHSQLAMMPPAAGLKLKSEAASPPLPAPPVERPPAPPPKAAALASAGIQIAASPPPPAARRTATVAAPPPRARRHRRSGGC